MRIHIPNYKSRDYLVVPSSASADWKVRDISPSPLSIKNHKVDTPFNGTRVIGAYKMEGAAVGSDSDPGLLATLLKLKRRSGQAAQTIWKREAITA